MPVRFSVLSTWAIIKRDRPCSGKNTEMDVERLEG